MKLGVKLELISSAVVYLFMLYKVVIDNNLVIMVIDIGPDIGGASKSS